MESIKDVSRIFDSSGGASLTGVNTFRLNNPESEEKLFRIVKVRDELQEKVTTLQKDLATRTSQVIGFSDEILNIARILRSDVKVFSDTLTEFIIFPNGFYTKNFWASE